MSQQLFLARQPILDRSQNVVAYELLFRSGNTEAAGVTDDLHATARVITNLFGEIGVESVIGTSLGFVNVSAELLLADMIELLPAGQMVLEILETVRVDARILERCVALKQLGFTLALDDFTLMREEYRPLLPLIDVVKVDVMGMDRLTLINTAMKLRKYPAKLLAEKIDSREQFDTCLHLGFHLFQGYFFARPTVLSSKRADPSKLTLLKLLGLVLEDANTPALEATFKQDPKLSYNLLRLVNSVACGLTEHIDSLSQAITALGRRQLQRWLQLLLYSLEQGPSHFPSPLMQLAATRGKFMEILAQRDESASRVPPEQAFMTGIFSLLDALIGLPMQDIVQQLRLSETIRGALLDRRGTLGTLLRLCEALERGDFAAAETLLTALPGIDAGTVTEAQVAAARWADSLSVATS